MVEILNKTRGIRRNILCPKNYIECIFCKFSAITKLVNFNFRKLQPRNSTKVNIPSNETGFIWLTFEKQLPRKKSKYTHEALVKTYGIVQDVEIFVKINESRPLKFSTVQVGEIKLDQEDFQIRTGKGEV